MKFGFALHFSFHLYIFHDFAEDNASGFKPWNLRVYIVAFMRRRMALLLARCRGLNSRRGRKLYCKFPTEFRQTVEHCRRWRLWVWLLKILMLRRNSSKIDF